MPFDKPADESDQNFVAGEMKFTANCIAGMRSGIFFGGNSIGNDQDLFARNAVFFDAAFQMRRDNRDQGGATKGDFIGETGDGGEQWLFPDALIADEFIHFDDDWNIASSCKDRRGAEEKGMP